MDANENEFEFACIRDRSRLKLLGTGFKKTQRCGERREISLGRVHSLVTRLEIGLSGDMSPEMKNLLVGFGVGWSWAGCVWQDVAQPK